MSENFQSASSQPIQPVPEDPSVPINPVQKNPLSPFFWFLFGILILCVGGIGGYYLIIKPSLISKQTVCTMEAKICPDGSTIGRTGPRCDFTPCPTSTSNITGGAASTSGLKYQDPCQIGDKRQCNMKRIYTSVADSYQTAGYEQSWKLAFAMCDANPNDSQILFDQIQCKIDVCNNLPQASLQDHEKCLDQVLPMCKNGSILEKIPCRCTINSVNRSYSQFWKDSYWDKYRSNSPPIYCCNGKQQDIPCTSN